MMDMSIDEAKAKIWTDDVNNELDEVRALLKKVNTANSTVAGLDDSIMDGIYKVGTLLGDTWDRMCNAFDDAQDKLKEAIKQIGKTVGNVLDDAEIVKSKIGGR